MSPTPLTALSSVDGRYARQTAPLREHLSEFGLIRNRVAVEVQWFRALAAEPAFPALPPLAAADQAALLAVSAQFDVTGAERIKAIEATTNHDVKAVEYFVKEQLARQPGLAPHLEMVHFGCTSEDINNLAWSLMLRDARDQVLLPVLDRVDDAVTALALRHADAAMLARTHGQPATPTTMGKEMAVLVARLRRQRQTLAGVALPGKINGATGNYNAVMAACPEVDWPALARRFVGGLGLEFNPLTTQIEPHDGIAELCHALQRVNTVLLDFARDIWGYIALDYFRQRKVETETGSSTMPHKVNPIDFENCEGNLGIANALLDHLAAKLPVSRWQRDLSDSTALRALGTAFGHTLIAWEAALRGIAKLEINSARIDADLDASWEVLAEPVQTVMRLLGLDEPYERLKAATRGERLNATTYRSLVESLELPTAQRDALLQLTPRRYLGAAATLAASVAERGTPR